jgi:hypothetical protein
MMSFGASLHVRQRKPRLALYDVTLPIPGGERDELKSKNPALTFRRQDQLGPCALFSSSTLLKPYLLFDRLLSLTTEAFSSWQAV